MWWILSGFIVGLIASSFMIFYWLYYLRVAIAKKGWKYTSYFLVLVWIAVFLSSASGLLRISVAIQEGSIADVMLFYTVPILYFVAVAALVAGVLLDTVTKIH